MATGPSPTAVRAARELRVLVGRLRRRLLDVDGPDALSPSHTALLGRIARGDATTAAGLAAAERITPQSVATVLGALQDRGLIERRPDPSDGRRQLIRLSTAGRRYIEGNRQARDEWLARALQDGFTETERRAVLRALELLERLA